MPKLVKEDDTTLRPVPGPVPPAAGEACPGCGEFHYGPCSVPPSTSALSAIPANGLSAPLRDGLGTREDIQGELDDIATAVRSFHLRQPDQVLRECAAYTARLTELAVLLHRVEALDRQYVRVRTQQVERWLTELDRQFRAASRLIEVMRQDLILSGAAT